MGRTLIRILVLVCIAFVVLLVTRSVRRHPSEGRHGEFQECQSGPIEQYVQPTTEEMRSYLHIANEIVRTYSNGQEKAMFEWAGRFPPMVYKLKGEDYLKVSFPINQAWADEWISNKGELMFTSADDFEQCVRMSLSLARIFGDFIVKSGVLDDVLVQIESRALERLQKYKIKFVKDERADCLRLSERFLSEWILQIESNHGFARRYLKDYERRMQWVIQSGASTPDELRQHVRHRVDSFQKFCNYTPKWLDDDFPPLRTR